MEDDLRQLESALDVAEAEKDRPRPRVLLTLVIDLAVQRRRIVARQRSGSSGSSRS
jgi:hypothetical protein